MGPGTRSDVVTLPTVPELVATVFVTQAAEAMSPPSGSGAPGATGVQSAATRTRLRPAALAS